MDTLNEMLSDKVSAERIIKANEEARKRDEDRSRERIAEYEKLTDDLRRLQFKSAEMNEQTSQLIATAIERIEGYTNIADVDISEDIAPILNAIDDLSKKLDDLNGKLGVDEARKHIEEHVHRENVRVYRNVQAVVENQAQQKTDEIKAEVGGLKKSINTTKIFSIITMIAALAALALQALKIFGVL